MTRAVAMHGAGDSVWHVGQTETAQHDYDFVRSQPRANRSAKQLAIALALGLWPLVTAPGLSALETHLPSLEAQYPEYAAQGLTGNGDAASQLQSPRLQDGQAIADPGLATSGVRVADAHPYRHCHNLSRRTYCHQKGRLPQNWPPNTDTPHRSGVKKKAPCLKGAVACSTHRSHHQG